MISLIGDIIICFIGLCFGFAILVFSFRILIDALDEFKRYKNRWKN